MLHYDRLYRMKRECKGEWAARILCELHYLCELSESKDNRFDGDINSAIDVLYEGFSSEGAITNSLAKRVEDSLLHLSKETKSLRIVLASHAHGDMNWMWGYNETVSIVLSTFRTMLNLLEEYPDFIFSQSMASTYRIVEKHEPAMLAEIQRYVKAGRWEITASEWTECDKNMMDGENQIRHILYTRKYLSKLFDLPESRFDIGFQPDSFGHNGNVPELLSHCGVKYYYFCRGIEAGADIFRFESPSGARILALREAHWYNSEINDNEILGFPKYAAKNKLDRILKVYGVGDHGGGATRRDLDLIREYDSWPLLPEFKFGTFREYFEYIDKLEWQVIGRELNFLNTGCYTSQSKIKALNKIVPRHLTAAETLDVMAGVYAGKASRTADLASGWEHVLFNHFHDILPGSCTTESRERAIGIYQESLASADAVCSSSALAVTDMIDYSSLMSAHTVPEKFSIGEGAGVGFLSSAGLSINGNPASGSTRIFTVFNPSQFDALRNVELQIWDYPYDVRKLEVKTAEGEALEFQVVDYKQVGYWGHAYNRLIVRLSVPAFGYRTLAVSQRIDVREPIVIPDWERTDPLVKYVLENEFLRAEFDPVTLALSTCLDKRTGEELVGEGGARFRFLEEDTTRYLTSWITGRIKKITDLTSSVICRPENYKIEPLRSWICYEVKFGVQSSLKVTVTLEKGSSRLDFAAECEFREFGSHETCTPNLEFYLPANGNIEEYRYEIPNGSTVRPAMDMNVPAINWAYPVKKGSGFELISADRNSFVGDKNALRLTLIRASFEPDPTPETGRHSIRFALARASGDRAELFENAARYLCPPLPAAVKAKPGTLTMTNRLFEVSGGIVTAVKRSEGGDGIVLRVFEQTGRAQRVKILAGFDVKTCRFCTGSESLQDEIPVLGREIEFELPPNCTETICITKEI